MMARFGSLLLCATLTLGAALLSCGGGSDGGSGGSAGGGGSGGGGGAGVGGTEAVLNIMPADGAITGWTRDPTEPKVANKVAAVATSLQGAVDLVDGGADPFWSSIFAPNVFAWQNYMNTTVNQPDGYTLKLYVLQMPSAAQASALYDSLVDGTHSLYTASNVWADTSPMIGDKGRIANTLTDWWINFRKGVYYCEIRLTYSESSDSVGKQQTLDFATAVAAKM
jgi:hypothetical protein